MISSVKILCLQDFGNFKLRHWRTKSIFIKFLKEIDKQIDKFQADLNLDVDSPGGANSDFALEKYLTEKK